MIHQFQVRLNRRNRLLNDELDEVKEKIHKKGDKDGISKAVERMKMCLQGEDYCIIPLLGKEYREGDADKCMFCSDETVPAGSSIIVSVKQPQINRGCRMIQAASVKVGQNVCIAIICILYALPLCSCI